MKKQIYMYALLVSFSFSTTQSMALGDPGTDDLINLTTIQSEEVQKDDVKSELEILLEQSPVEGGKISAEKVEHNSELSSLEKTVDPIQVIKTTTQVPESTTLDQEPAACKVQENNESSHNYAAEPVVAPSEVQSDSNDNNVKQNDLLDEVKENNELHDNIQADVADVEPVVASSEVQSGSNDNNVKQNDLLDEVKENNDGATEEKEDSVIPSRSFFAAICLALKGISSSIDAAIVTYIQEPTANNANFLIKSINSVASSYAGQSQNVRMALQGAVIAGVVAGTGYCVWKLYKKVQKAQRKS